MVNGNTNGHDNTNGTINGNGDSKAKEELDIIDEAFLYFKPNVFFKAYEIQSNADRVLIYLTLYIIECLKRLARLNCREAGLQELHALAISRFDIPGKAFSVNLPFPLSEVNIFLSSKGDPGFPLNAVYLKPNSAEEADYLRQYILQLRQECGVRLVDRVFDGQTGKPSKWWLCFAKRKFMDITLSGPTMK